MKRRNVCATLEAMTADEFKQRRNALGMTQKQIAEAMAVSLRSVNGWECGQTIPDRVDLMLQAVEAKNKRKKKV